MSKLTHTDEEGRASMVNVGAKPDQERIAKAKGRISLNPETVRLIRDNQVKKGDVLTVAEIAGIQGGKKTSELIPLCHPLQITKLDVKAVLLDDGVEVNSRRTGRSFLGNLPRTFPPTGSLCMKQRPSTGSISEMLNWR